MNKTDILFVIFQFFISKSSISINSLYTKIYEPNQENGEWLKKMFDRKFYADKANVK